MESIGHVPEQVATMRKFPRVAKLGGSGESAGILSRVGALTGCVGSLGFCTIFASACTPERAADVNVINQQPGNPLAIDYAMSVADVLRSTAAPLDCSVRIVDVVRVAGAGTIEPTRQRVYFAIVGSDDRFLEADSCGFDMTTCARTVAHTAKRLCLSARGTQPF